jgi:hypothetical protein
MRVARRVCLYILSTKFLALQAEACNEGAQEYIAGLGNKDSVFFGHQTPPSPTSPTRAVALKDTPSGYTHDN